MEEKRLQLFFNFGLETCLTSRDWSTGRPTRAVGKKIFWKNFFGKFSQFNFSRLKLNKNGLKWKKVRKETQIIFQFWIRNVSDKVGRMDWKTRQSVVGRKTFRSNTLYHTSTLVQLNTPLKLFISLTVYAVLWSVLDFKTGEFLW